MFRFFCTNKKECDDGKTSAYKLRFIDSFRFMSTLLSELVDNMSGNFNFNFNANHVRRIIDAKNAKYQ